jgi:hypothetical protein
MLMRFFISCLLTLFTANAHANNASIAPPDFESFFVNKELSTRVFIAGDAFGQEVRASINYDNYHLVDKQQNIELLVNYLRSFELKEAFIVSLIETLITGIQTDNECSGVLSRCVLQAAKNKPRFVYDYDNQTVKVFTAPDDLNQLKKSKLYHNAQRKNNALVNWIDVNLYSDLNGENNLAINNETRIGLPLGYLNFDTQYSSNPQKLKTYTALYDVEYSGLRVQAGKHRYNLEFNSTDFLTNNANYGGNSLYMGSSASLLKGKVTRYQSIDFIAPQLGLLQVFRENRLILSKTVSEGANSINYSELPSGTYTIRLSLKVGNTEVINEKREVVNLKEYALSIGENDIVVGAGQLSDEFINIDDSENYTDFSREYVRAAMTHRYSESTLLALSFTTNQQDYIAQLGSKVYLSNGWSINYFNAIASSKDFYQQVRLSYDSFYLDSQFNHQDEDESNYDVMAHLYGKRTYRSVGGGWSGNLLKGSAFVRYHIQNFSSSSDSQQVQRNLSLGWSRGIGKHNVSVNLDWKHGDLDEVTAYLSWSYNFNSNMSAHTTTLVDEDGFRNNATSLGYSNSGDNWQNQSSLGGFTDNGDNKYIEFSNSFSGHNDQLNANSYLYASSASQENLSVSLSGSQIVTTDSLNFTRHKSDAFIKINQPKDHNVNIALSKEGEFQRNETMEQSSMLIPVEGYQSFTLNADGSADNTYIKAGKLQTFVHPATLAELTIEAIKLSSEIVVLTKKDGSPVSWARCTTDLCQIEPLSEDGVFRVNYTVSDSTTNSDISPDTSSVTNLSTNSAKHYQLVTELGDCAIADDNINKSYKLGYCP